MSVFVFLAIGDEAKDELMSEAQPEPPQKPCVGGFGSFSGQFSDGLSVSVSTYGSSGHPVDGKMDNCIK